MFLIAGWEKSHSKAIYFDIQGIALVAFYAKTKVRRENIKEVKICLNFLLFLSSWISEKLPPYAVSWSFSSFLNAFKHRYYKKEALYQCVIVSNHENLWFSCIISYYFKYIFQPMKSRFTETFQTNCKVFIVSFHVQVHYTENKVFH